MSIAASLAHLEAEGLRAGTALAELAEAARAVQEERCSSDGCTDAAVYAVRFHDQAGHVHDCAKHTAELREFCDVAEVVPLSGGCPWPHGDGRTWTDQPRDLT